MKISVKLTRAENTALLGAGPVELDLDCLLYTSRCV